MSDKIGVFGGSFNPPHNGHLHLLRSVTAHCGLDYTIVIPSFISPHKQPSAQIAPEARLEMCRLAFTAPGTIVSDTELRRGGTSYTYDTLTELKRSYDGELYLIIGADMLLCFDKWYRYRDILSIAVLAAACRTDTDAEPERLCEKAEELTLLGGRVVLSDTKPYEMSSTQIRNAVKNREDISGYVPAAVANYIKNGGYYHG